MMRKLSTTVILLGLLFQFQLTRAQFPYVESFMNTTAPSVNFGGSPTAFLTAGHPAVGDPVNGGYLRLTNNGNDQTGFVYSDFVFPSTNGLKIEFEYFTYGGNRADGIAFFLFDAATPVFNIGAFGGSLGYAPNAKNSPVAPGVSNGYIGVGLDEYGNYSDLQGNGLSGIGFRPEAVAIRGKGNGSALTPTNYKFLTSVQVVPLGFNLTGGAIRHPDPTDPEYRKAYIDLKPNPLGGYNISVRIGIGGNVPTIFTVIDNYYYPETAPALLRYGISSSTGAQNNFHEIRNLKINPFVNTLPVAVNNSFSTLKNTPTLVDIIANDTDFDGNNTIVRSTLVIKSQPLNGTLTINPATFNVLYTPNPGYTGLDSYTYTIKDDSGGESNVATVSIQVIDTFEPVANNDNATTITGTPVSIDILVNDTGGSGTLARGSVLTSAATNGTLTLDPSTGRVLYTPTGDFHGRDVFTYTVRNSTGLISNIATVTVTVRPKGSDDNSNTRTNTPVIINVKANDVSRNGTTVLPKTNPLNGTAVVNSDGTVTYTPRNGFFGTDVFTYSLVNSVGSESDPITVNILVNDPPIAVNDAATTNVGKPVIIDVPLNDTDTDGTINRGSVVITIPPLNGTLSIDAVTGKVTYTPNPGFIGPDIFTYTIADNRGQVSNPARVNITVRSAPKIGLAKSLVSSVLGVNGTYDIKYLFTIINFGQEVLQNISLTDDLAKTFGPSIVTVRKITPLGTLKANAAYNGTTVTELLQPGSSIPSGGQQLVELEINVTLTTQEGIFSNTGFAEGTDIIDGSKTTDQSTDGVKPDPTTPQDVTPLVPTPVTLVFQPLFIPEGYSPNGDGRNDFFVIRNTNGKKVSLEVFNRWGNRVYRSTDYLNTWDGKCTEGIRLGEDVPNGTYYYIILLNGTEKYVGHLTLNR